jgi:hypothetical protein
MLVFIDDSGDPGIKLERGSSLNFCLCALKFSDTLEAEKCAVSIKEWKRKNKFKDVSELKFNKLNHKERLSILKTLEKFCFEIYAITHIKNTSDKISYTEYINILFKKYGDNLCDSKIFIDGSGESNSLNIFKNKIIKNTSIQTSRIKIVDSKNNTLIQMADIFVGAINKDLSGGKFLQKYKINNFTI